jgi:uncharacterized membrane protein YjfL (UPF0719 family)
MDRDSTFFLLKMWGGIALVLVVIAFLMAKQVIKGVEYPMAC